MMPTKKILVLILFTCMFLQGEWTFSQTADPAARLVKRGVVLFEKLDYAGAVTLFNSAIELKPDFAEAYLRRGHVERAQGALDKSIEDYEKAGSLDPHILVNNRQVADAYVNRGSIKRNKMEVDSALIDYERAIKINPARHRIYVERGEARILAEDFQGAITDFDYFLKQEMLVSKNNQYKFGMAIAYCDRGVAKTLLGMEAGGKRDIEEGLRLVPQDASGIEEHIKGLELQLLVIRRIHPRTPGQVSQAFSRVLWNPALNQPIVLKFQVG
jgi:tetratricopeptide (TPR) repeat protein